MLAPNNRSQSPIAVLGAGDLVSHLRRIDSGSDDTAGYRFNVFREDSSGEVTHALRSDDLHDLLHLCYVLAFAILDDGWVDEQERLLLQQLIAKLECLRILEGDPQHG